MKSVLNVLGIFLLTATALAAGVGCWFLYPTPTESAARAESLSLGRQLAPLYAATAAIESNALLALANHDDVKYQCLMIDKSLAESKNPTAGLEGRRAECLAIANQLKEKREAVYPVCFLIAAPLANFTLLAFALARWFRPPGSPSLPASDATR